MPTPKLTKEDADKLRKGACSAAKPTSSRELGTALNPDDPVNHKTVSDRIKPEQYKYYVTRDASFISRDDSYEYNRPTER